MNEYVDTTFGTGKDSFRRFKPGNHP